MKNALLQNVVRFHVYETLQEHAPACLGDFEDAFGNWLRSERKPGADKDLVGRLSSGFAEILSRTTAPDPESVQVLLDSLFRGRKPPGEEITYLRDRLIANKNAYNSSLSGPLGNRKETNEPEIIGEDPSWLEIVKQAEKAARSDFPVLIVGETGVGKELIAQLIHSRSRWKSGECVFLNCAALPEGLIESELFGYEGGAFTGALRSGRKGWIKAADGGTLVLDEISELSPHAQAALLRTLQNGELQRIGGGVVQADFRLVSISNRPLEPEVESGSFRRDLFYRVAVIPLNPPPLRERNGDIMRLAEFFLERFKKRNRDYVDVNLSTSAIEALNKHRWEGNARELENVIARALVLCPEREIQSRHLVLGMAGAHQDSTESRHLKDRIERLDYSWSVRIPADRLAGFLLDHRDGITSSSYSKQFDCSESTARRHLDSLHTAGILDRRGEKRGRRYLLV